jgi:hypothetical protein
MSIKELTARLTEMKETLRTREKLQNDLGQVRQSLEEERTRLDALAATLHKETRDVERLEGLSLMGLFYEVLGSKDEQIEKERREQLAAHLKHVQCGHAVVALEQDLAELTRRLSDLKGLDERYASVLGNKEKLLLENDGPEARQLVELAEKSGSLNSTQKELQEAIMAGEAVQESLRKVVDSLDRASGWGTWDLLGGGMIATAFKHDRIDDARDNVHEAQMRLKRFERELKDVRLDVNVVIDIGSFATFADYFFDNLITDWIVRSRIEESRESAHRAHENVQQAIVQLRERARQVGQQIKAAVEERRNVVERA